MKFPTLATAILSSALLFSAPLALCAPRHTPQLFSKHPGNAPQSLDARRNGLNTLFSEIWSGYLAQHPLFASSIGNSHWNSQLADDSVASFNQQAATQSQQMLRIAAIDTTGMSPQEVLSRDLIASWLIHVQEATQFSPWEMLVNPYTGIQISLPRLIPRLSFTTTQDYDDYLSRLHKLPAALQQITDGCMLGMADQRVPTKEQLQLVLNQVNAILAQQPQNSPFAWPIRHFPASISAADQKTIRKSVLAAITTDVYPAYKRFARFLKLNYIPAAATRPGLWNQPGGPAWYTFLVRQNTNSTLTPDLIHQLALRQIQKDDQAELAIAKQLGDPTVAALRAAIAANPKLHPASAQALLDAYRSAISQSSAKLPTLFTAVPKTSVTVQPMPAFMDPSTTNADLPAVYKSGTLYVNTTGWRQRSLASVQAIACQQVLPGRQFQAAAADSLTSLPAFRRQFPVPAYTHGWTLYAAQLCQDAALYQNPWSEFGRLESDRLRAIAAAVDTGIHADQWTRQQAIDFVHQRTSLDAAAIDALVDRCIALPGRALGYTMGEIEFMRLRDQAQKALGAKFSLRAFNDQLLASGPLPLDTLAKRTAAWISTQSK